MPSKVLANSNNKSLSRNQAVQPEAQSDELHDQPMVSASAVQQARVMPQLLTSIDVLQLQRTIENQAPGRFSAQIDNRPEAIAQREMPEVANNSPLVTQLRAIQKMTNTSPQARQAVQFQAIADHYSTQQQHPVQEKENTTGLPDNLKSGIENLSGYSMEDVHVHYNSDKPAQLQAHAYAQGTDIHLGPGQARYLPHEAWHVVQQKQGRVRPTMQMKGIVTINNNRDLEQEAEVMGAKALQANGKDLSNPAILVAPIPKVLQAVWKAEATEFGTTYVWDELMDGVRWYADEAGNMWYRIEQKGELDYSDFEGKKLTFTEWHKLRSEINPDEYYLPFLDYEKESNSFEENATIMNDIVQQATSKVALLKGFTSEPEFLAKQCVNIMEVLNDQARQRMEGQKTRLKDKRFASILKEVIKLINNLNQTDDNDKRISFLGDFYGWNIANQNFQESNNRGTYIMVVLIGGIYDLPIPSVDKALSRAKTPFIPKKIKDQFMKMYDDM